MASKGQLPTKQSTTSGRVMMPRTPGKSSEPQIMSQTAYWSLQNSDDITSSLSTPKMNSQWRRTRRFSSTDPDGSLGRFFYKIMRDFQDEEIFAPFQAGHASKAARWSCPGHARTCWYHITSPSSRTSDQRPQKYGHLIISYHLPMLPS